MGATTSCRGDSGPFGEERVCHIIQFNDVYNLEAVFDEDPVGGAARFRTVLKEIQASISPARALIVFSGDFVGPSLMSTFTQGAHIIDAMNLIGVDYASFGNHEFDFGYPSLLNVLKGVDPEPLEGEPFVDYPSTQTQWLCTNMSEGGGNGCPVGGEATQRTAICVVNGVKVGLLAVAENWIPGCVQLKEGEIVYEDHVESARKAAQELRANGAEVVFALTHNRLKNDRELAAAVPEIDLLLGGHDHFYKRDRKNRIVKGGQEWRWLNLLTVKTDRRSQKPDVIVDCYDVSEETEEDPDMLELVAKYQKLAHAKYSRVIAESKVDLDAREEVCRFKEGTLPNWICDVVAEDFSIQEGLQSADIALLQGFAFSGKKVFKAGPLTLGQLMDIFPIPCDIVVLKLSGEDIVKSLTLACASLPGECGFLHHCNSRLSYKVKLGTAGVDKPSVVDVRFNKKPLDLKRKYTVAVSSDMAKGKFGFSWMAEGQAERVVDEESALSIQCIIRMWCRRRRKGHTKDGKPVDKIDPKMGRIEII